MEEEEEHKVGDKRQRTDIPLSTRYAIIALHNHHDSPSTIYNSLHGTIILNSIKSIIHTNTYKYTSLFKFKCYTRYTYNINWCYFTT
jgi:hypothetical protein